MDSTLSSSLPLVLPRSSSLPSMTSSVVEKNRTNDDLQTCRHCVSHHIPTFASKRVIANTHGIVKLDGLIHLSWETVNQEPTLGGGPVARQRRIGWERGRAVECVSHGILEELGSMSIQPGSRQRETSSELTFTVTSIGTILPSVMYSLII